MPITDEMLAHGQSRTEELAVPEMSSHPGRHVAVLCCMDTRIDLYALLGLQRGDAHILRNAGGLVTDDVIRSLSGSQRLLGTREVVVIMHEHCGLCGGSEDEFTKLLVADGALPPWRLGAFSDVDAALAAGLARLRSAPELPHRDQIRGFVFDPKTGGLREGQAGG